MITTDVKYDRVESIVKISTFDANSALYNLPSALLGLCSNSPKMAIIQVLIIKYAQCSIRLHKFSSRQGVHLHISTATTCQNSKTLPETTENRCIEMSVIFTHFFFNFKIFFSRSTPKIDRSSAETMSVTVGSVTVVITDYKPKVDKKTSSSSADLHQHVTSDSSNCSVLSGINRHADDFVGNGSSH